MDMKKQKYYVGVGSGQITRQPETTEWEFEIEATEEQITRLRELFERANKQNLDIAYLVLHPLEGRKEEHDLKNYDHTLQEIYRMIYELGSEETKKFIRENQIIQELGKDYM